MPRGRAANTALLTAVANWFAEGLGEKGLIGELYADGEIPQMPHPYVMNTVAATYNAGFSTLYASTGTLTLEVLRAGPELLRGLDTGDLSALILASDELLR